MSKMSQGRPDQHIYRHQSSKSKTVLPLLEADASKKRLLMCFRTAHRRKKKKKKGFSSSFLLGLISQLREYLLGNTREKAPSGVDIHSTLVTLFSLFKINHLEVSLC